MRATALQAAENVRQEQRIEELQVENRVRKAG